MFNNVEEAVKDNFMIGLVKGKVILAEYDKNWAIEFEKEKNAIQQAISGYKIKIEHVGSTSVKSLCAKPIIDILIGIEHFNDGFECVHDLEAIGYESKGENGVSGRHFFAKGNPRTHHIHMVEINSNFWKEHLLFRDYLKNNSDIRIRYSELKKKLALKYKNDREKYTSSKSEFIQEIIKKAKEGKGTMNNHIEIAKRFIDEEFSDCQVALLAGSVVREEATETSDLDIVIITEDERTPFRQSFFKHDWMIETFVFGMESYKLFFDQDYKTRIPTIFQMCKEGIIIKDTNGLSDIVKKDANEWMDKGVTPYSDKEIEAKRYMLTSMIDDLIGCSDFEQQIFIANQMIEYACNIILVTNGHWEAKGKWIQKRMKEFDPKIYKEMISALNIFYKNEDKNPLIQFVEKEMDKFCGRLFEGYYREAKK